MSNGTHSPRLGSHKPHTPLRAAKSHKATGDSLGPLKNLPGYWEGPGFSLIARPDFSGKSPNGFFLQLNWLRETLEFTAIGSPVLNRGSVQEDIAIYGVTYLHRVIDGETGGALHVEPGMWLNIPATEAPKQEASIARLGTIPHGNAFCTVGMAIHEVVNGLPAIPPSSTVPFDIGTTPPEPGTRNPFPEYDLSIPSEFRSNPLPAGLTQAIIDDPLQMLRDTVAEQVNGQGCKVKEVDLLITSSSNSVGGIANIPFINANANALDMQSVFGIQTMIDSHGNEFLQMQYSQHAMLNFRGKTFPHVTVGTLIKSF
jgi:hypothetical protein